MSDRFAGTIRIGGAIPPHAAPGLLEAIRAQGASLHWGGADFEPRHAKDLVKAAARGVLVLVDDQATYGEFDRLEAFCAGAGIDFDRHSEAKYEYDAEVVKFRRGMKKPWTVASDQEEGEYVLRRPVDAARRLLGRGTVKHLREALRRLNRVLGPDLPDLTPFRIQKREGRNGFAPRRAPCPTPGRAGRRK